MARPSPAERWTNAALARVAEKHFPGQQGSLRVIVQQLAEGHHTAWASTSLGVYRPTPAMFTLALLWEVERIGPNCVFCEGRVEVPSQPSDSGPSGPTLTLGFRVPPGRGGLNVPQNLTLCHAGCLSDR